ncbi:Os01g0388533 [Oryza sativa Japonica Group]|uniref:Os01g0388533 protein n=1 Tax=Oryza sativa subsp. japonica TaxID=39947 RepID=C7IXA2_ORYSJ|nr:Os01g0388533 [Oryza sativa Japonica Group]|eukprot:NP_001172358.1 Os01g0388533 [Oryza sativa Japonica Group]
MAWRTGGCAGRCLLPLVLLAAESSNHIGVKLYG